MGSPGLTKLLAEGYAERGRALDAKDSELAAARAQVEEMREAIFWALGCADTFPERGPTEGAFWWRMELANRASITREDMSNYIKNVSAAALHTLHTGGVVGSIPTASTIFSTT